MSENKADPLREALEPFAALAEHISEKHHDSRPIIYAFDGALTTRLTIGDLRRAKAALVAPQPAAPSKLASSERLGPHYDGTRSITRSLTPDGGGVTTPTPQPAAPLGGREALRSCCSAGGELGCSCADQNYQWFGPACQSVMAQAIKKLLKSEALAAIPQERGVDRAAIIEECILAAYAHHASMHVIEALRYLAGKESEKYLVWSNEHRCWWRANSAGYTNKIDSAGRYDRAEAISISRGLGWPSTGIPDEVPVLERDAIECFGKTIADGTKP